MVPTSAHSGDGMGNLIALLCEVAQTMLAKRIMYSEELQATVMEVCKITLMLSVRPSKLCRQTDVIRMDLSYLVQRSA